MHLRRRMIVKMETDPPAHNWWEARTAADFDHMRFDLCPRGGDAPVAVAMFRSMELYGSNLVRTLGLVNVEVQPQHRRQGAAAAQ